ncbi:hypothetical protein C8Q74DRAFT_1373117 [Fomes fomentarius]|nr:hypothetical protein C8Q74DRAFT_1373117 [Fomes fomentarius]
MSTSSPPINIDDGDIDDILYQPADLWIHQKDEPNYQAGTHSRGFTNAYAEFKFNGTNIAVYGVALPNPQWNNDTGNGSTSAAAATVPPSARFSIDGGIPLTVVSNPDLQEAEFAHQFYDSHTLPTGEHVLQMNVTYGTAEWPFILDYIHYTPLEGQPPSAGQGAGAGASKPRVPYWNHRPRWWRCGIQSSPKEKVDLLEEECKVPPPSPPFPAMEFRSEEHTEQQTYPESVFSTDGPSYYEHTSEPNLSGTGYFLYRSIEHERTFSEAQYEPCPTAGSTRPPSPTNSHSDISSHACSESKQGHRFGRQLPPTPITPPSSSSTGTRPARPSTADSSHPLLPPAPAHHRPSTPLSSPTPPIVRGAATPDSARTAETSQTTSKARKAGISHAGPKGKQPTFHADSGVRFSYREVSPARPAPVRVLANPDSASSHVSGGEEGWEKERNKMKLEEKEKLKRNVLYGGSAISEVPPMYTEA